ncbi:MAG: hypothetical protein WCW02_03800 [Candidatus Buchananbacteria bacterium]
MSEEVLAKFNSLAPNLRQAIANVSAQRVLRELKDKYQLNAFNLVLKIAKQEVALAELETYLTANFTLTVEQAKEIKTILINKIFQPVLGHLNYIKTASKIEVKAPATPTKPIMAPLITSKIIVQPTSVEAKTEIKPVKLPATIFPTRPQGIVRSAENLDRPVSNWHLFPEDEEEIKKLANQNSARQRDNLPNILEQEAKRLIQLAGLTLTSPELTKKLVNILMTYLRGVRDWVETRGFLMHEASAGGVSLTKEQAENLLTIVDRQRRSLESLRQSSETLATSDQVAETDQLMQAKRMATVNANPRPGQPQAPSGFKKSADLLPQKPVIEDIKYAKKLVGPVEELAGFDLIDFRRLNPDPEQARQKIRGKIELLSTEGIAKKVAGIKAWQSSPVNQLYLQIIQQALLASQALSEAISLRQQNNQPTLTLAEFQALAELNKQLKY